MTQSSEGELSMEIIGLCVTFHPSQKIYIFVSVGIRRTFQDFMTRG